MAKLHVSDRALQRLRKAALPIVGLVALAFFWYKASQQQVSTGVSLWIRLYYAAFFTVAMEYIARYQHKYLWHSRWLWFLHASHHHHSTKFGAGPSKSDSESNAFLPPRLQTFELNDVFPVIFSSLAMLAMFWAHTTAEIIRDNNAADSTRMLVWVCDMVFGSAVGISAYGTSYFIGHDLVAHERGGSRLAEWCKQTFPWMKRFSEIHSVYHHKIDVHAATDEDPYGPPYGFWLGPQEVAAFQNGKELGLPMWFQIQCALATAFAGVSVFHAAVV